MISCCFYVFLNNFFVPYGWTLNRVGGQISNVESTYENEAHMYTKHAWHKMSFDVAAPRKKQKQNFV